jgi:hypothetical protein
VGQIAGISASILAGTRFATWATSTIGSLKWAGIVGLAADTASDLYGLARTTQNTYYAAQDGWQVEDNLNLLGYVPFALKGVSKVIAGARAVKSPDVELKNLETTQVRAGDPPATGGSKSLLEGSGGCFTAGTEILTTEGIKNIEDIQAGDWVIVDDPTTPGEIEKRQVLVAYERQATTLIDIYVDGEIISATEEHPIWVVDKGWVEPKDLQVGDLLQTKDGRVVDVDKIEKRESDFKVYNFRVEGIPTYFVSDLEILVHNNTNCPGDVPSRKQSGKFTEPTLPDKEVARQGEIKIVHNYRSNDHAPAHVHVTGGGKETRIRINGEPMPGDPAPTSKQ